MSEAGFWITLALMGIGTVALLAAFVGGIEREDEREPIEHEVDEP